MYSSEGQKIFSRGHDPKLPSELLSPSPTLIVFFRLNAIPQAGAPPGIIFDALKPFFVDAPDVLTYREIVFNLDSENPDPTPFKRFNEAIRQLRDLINE